MLTCLYNKYDEARKNKPKAVIQSNEEINQIKNSFNKAATIKLLAIQKKVSFSEVKEDYLFYQKIDELDKIKENWDRLLRITRALLKAKEFIIVYDLISMFYADYCDTLGATKDDIIKCYFDDIDCSKRQRNMLIEYINHRRTELFIRCKKNERIG